MSTSGVKTHLRRNTRHGKRGKACASTYAPLSLTLYETTKEGGAEGYIARIIRELETDRDRYRKTAFAWKAKSVKINEELTQCRDDLHSKTVELEIAHDALIGALALKDQERQLALEEKEDEHALVLKRQTENYTATIMNQRKELRGFQQAQFEPTSRAEVAQPGFIPGPFHQPNFVCCYDMSFVRPVVVSFG